MSYFLFLNAKALLLNSRCILYITISIIIIYYCYYTRDCILDYMYWVYDIHKRLAIYKVLGTN